MQRALPIIFLLICGPLLADELMSLKPAHSIEAYQVLSNALNQLDQATIERELTTLNANKLSEAPATKRFGFNPDAAPEFFTTTEGKRIADIVLSYQTPSGGWSKRTDMSFAPRRPGQAFGVEQNYIPTFDNGATTTQVWLLAKAHQATGNPSYANAIERAVQLMTLAQYPNGGWPQNFPLTGGYHDYITYNDDVTVKLLQVLNSARQQQPPFDFIDDKLAARAEQSFQRGLSSVLATQIKVGDTATLWGAQHHHKTLEPINARKFEPIALATAESADLVEFLMTLDNPNADIKQAIVAAHNWFAANKIYGYQWGKQTSRHNALTPAPGAGPLWGRFCEIGTNRPVFGDRDGSVHYEVSEISTERRDGYAWYTSSPKRVLKKFPAWKAKYLD
ncbi:pectate lyase [Gilvimarinus sp. SDUM040013]|uniref:Pectate lyase n=1 Tax=Gilvimarinus gilvus TaxID=3058038 RepID=A0ABU4RZN2_9GAMM|nr:pectate lyase [Gilvimarinus sp. SDUM040013]MDO3387606.1 pectate lyase [Gilvimarinus sp. SDUM040013]MDX6850129.1 pectate lyase [Gilvimarinus sp. SDUM040013]